MHWQEFDYSAKSDFVVPASSENSSATYYYSVPPNYFTSQYQENQIYCSKYEASEYPQPEPDFEAEPPLLEELGINFSHIKEKTLAVLNPTGRTTAEVIEDQDLAGPLVFCLLLGFALLLQGKLSFGEIYVIAFFGCIGIYALMNALSVHKSISFCCTASILGYCLLPMTIISFIITISPLKGEISYFLAAFAIFWCTSSSSKLIVTAMNLSNRYILVAYPCFLIYSMFALLAIF